MPTKVSASVKSVTCTSCGNRMGLAALRTRQGLCMCNASAFDVVLAVRRIMTDSQPVTPEMAGVMVAGALVGIAVIPTGQASVVSDQDYELAALPGPAVLELDSLPPEEALRWMSDLRKEMAKLNLRPDQGLCTECGEIFARSTGGPTAEGFCSRLCSERAARNAPPAAVEVQQPAEPVILACPKCNRPAKIGKTASGKPRKCVWCGAAVQA